MTGAQTVSRRDGDRVTVWIHTGRRTRERARALADQHATPGESLHYVGAFVGGCFVWDAVPVAPDACGWCGRPGCEPERHPEALADMRADAVGVLPGWELWRDDPRHDEANP